MILFWGNLGPAQTLELVSGQVGFICISGPSSSTGGRQWSQLVSATGRCDSPSWQSVPCQLFLSSFPFVRQRWNEETIHQSASSIWHFILLKRFLARFFYYYHCCFMERFLLKTKALDVGIIDRLQRTYPRDPKRDPDVPGLPGKLSGLVIILLHVVNGAC